MRGSSLVLFALVLLAAPLANAQVPISGLPSATLPLAGTESAPLVQGGITKKAPSIAFGPNLAAPGPIGGTTPSTGTFTTIAGSVTATGTTTARTLAARFSDVVNLKDMGAKCDGTTDDTTAIQAWLNKAAPNVELLAPAGTCVFTAAVSTPSGGINDVALAGAGPGPTIFKYTGVNTTNDIWTTGDGSNGYANWYIHGIAWRSATIMSGGYLVHFKRLWRSQLSNVVFDGEDGPHGNYNGVYFDGVDWVVLSQFEAQAINDAIDVSGTVAGGQADLMLTEGKIGGSAVGLHIGGGFGGMTCDNVDIISNHVNVLIDNALQAITNREVFLGPNCLLDSATTDSLQINDTLSGSMTVDVGGWIASTSAGNGIHIIADAGGKVSVKSPVIWNNSGDGIRVDDSSTVVAISAATIIHSNGGYGVNATVATNGIFPGMEPLGNTSGAYSANAHVESYGVNTGYKKFSNGIIEEWGFASITGAANTVLTAAVTYPLPFPNAQLDRQVSLGGFANGAHQTSVSSSPTSTTGANISIVSDTTVTSAQTVNYHVWGY